MSSKNASVQSSTLLDRLTPTWVRNQQWRERLAEKSAYRSLDIPEDVNITSNKSGVSTGGAIGIAAIAALAAAGPLAWMMYNQQQKPIAPIISTSPIHQPVATAPTFQQKDSSWAAVKEEQQADGSWKQIGIVHYRSRSGVVEQLMTDGTWQVVPGATAPSK